MPKCCGYLKFQGKKMKRDNDRHIDGNINVYKLEEICPKLMWMSVKYLIPKENLVGDIITQGNYKEKEKRNNCSKRITLISDASMARCLCCAWLYLPHKHVYLAFSWLDLGLGKKTILYCINLNLIILFSLVRTEYHVRISSWPKWHIYFCQVQGVKEIIVGKKGGRGMTTSVLYQQYFQKSRNNCAGMFVSFKYFVKWITFYYTWFIFL